MTADGGTLKISETENADLLPAARVGLGALGVLVDVTLRCVPHFMLHALERPEPLDEVLDNWIERATAVDHFEFYWFPHTKPPRSPRPTPGCRAMRFASRRVESQPGSTTSCCPTACTCCCASSA